MSLILRVFITNTFNLCLYRNFADETHRIEAVLGKTANLPCDIESKDKQNVVYMVLWFKKNDDKPIYR